MRGNSSTNPTASHPFDEPVIARPDPLKPPSSFHRRKHRLSPTSHRKTSESFVSAARSPPSAPAPVHHSALTVAPHFRPPTTCPAPLFQSKRCTFPPRPAT